MNDTFEYKFDKLNKDTSAIFIFKSTDTPQSISKKNFEPHTHDFIEIIYVLSGSAVERIGGEEYEVRRGDLLFINYGSTHCFQPLEPFTYVNICFKPEVIAGNVITPENAFAVLQLTAFDEMRQESNESMVSFSGVERDSIEQILFAMLEERDTQRDSWRTVIESYMNILIIRILRRVRFGETDRAESDVWTQLFAYIDQNLDADLTLPTLAQKCFYNPSYFSRIFKERFGISLSEYINRRRIDHAIFLYRETELTGEEIAVRAGFSSKSSFYRVFTSITGRAPSEYRDKKSKKTGLESKE